ncbi:endoplasmic reticulum-based factor for assembly of V-ATPase-domain-containing protein [Lophiotrema nucula]|uniref:Endoplasmic reticulum-based factor for assembly of V-ATPase-domain-containing protein n=1 Tax=Lophiotrema nucula TaxID=690887 RepID=A0A6A5Z928_9PLEO|nr:endoplasmic reticulum-based factor for assembly of V-ATPase-domain-containing protein [Lophiotrema nucula]
MVLFTVTPAIVRALSTAQSTAPEELSKLQQSSEPSLSDPKEGNPISHSQLIDIAKLLKTHKAALQPPENENERPSYTLASLLKGARVYIPPPAPKPEPSSEYKALMTRLRREEESRAYERLLNPHPPAESFSQRFPTASPHAFLDTAHNIKKGDVAEEDEVSFEEVHRQIILIINVLVSIVACSVFIWVAARHWSVGKRLGLSMSGSGVIAVAEVVIYSGYVRRVKEAKTRERKKPEIKEIIESWVIDGKEKDGSVAATGVKEKGEDSMRFRKGKHR